MKYTKGFVLYQRELKSGMVYYARFKKPDGKYGSGVNTGQTTQQAATSWCNSYMQRNGVKNSTGYVIHQDNSTLRSYSTGFFNWDSEWSIDKRDSGHRLSQRQCKEKANILTRLILPVLGDIKLLDINAKELKVFRNNMLKSYSASTVNKCLQCISAILKQAKEQDIINNAPIITSASGKNKERGILTVQEFYRVFDVEWKPGHGRLANLLSAYTGMRASEIQGLLIGDLHLEERYLIVSRAWDENMGILNATTKNGKARRIILHPVVVVEFQRFLAKHPRNNDSSAFVFHAATLPDKPCEQAVFTRSLYAALESIGITEEERKTRNIVFHSWRHFANSLRITSEEFNIIEVQASMGHSSNEMSLNYFHSDVSSIDSQVSKLEKIYNRPVSKSIQ